MSYLVLVRHGESIYNQQGLWAGWDNPPLTEQGKQEAIKAGEALKDIQFDQTFSSDLIRAQDTLTIILKILQRSDLPVTIDKALRERNYGDFTAKNKWEIKKQLGDDEFLKLRRAWDYPIPNGESLKQVYERTIPYYESVILPKLKNGKNILISSSGNALRSLVKYLDNIPDDKIAQLEIATGEVCVYQIDANGKVISKETRQGRPNIA